MKNSAFLWWKNCEYTQMSIIDVGFGDGNLGSVGGVWANNSEFMVGSIGRDPFDNHFIGQYVSYVGVVFIPSKPHIADTQIGYVG